MPIGEVLEELQAQLAEYRTLKQFFATSAASSAGQPASTPEIREVGYNNSSSSSSSSYFGYSSAP